MGLFDFVSDIGKKVFSKEEDASKAVTQHIAEDNPGVENLSVTVENGVANIQGVASTAAALEKAVLMAGNIIGISNVNIDDVTVKKGLLLVPTTSTGKPFNQLKKKLRKPWVFHSSSIMMPT